MNYKKMTGEMIKCKGKYSKVITLFSLYSFALKEVSDKVSAKFGSDFVRDLLAIMKEEHIKVAKEYPEAVTSQPNAIIASADVKHAMTDTEKLTEMQFLSALHGITFFQNIITSLADGEDYIFWVDENREKSSAESSCLSPFCTPITDDDEIFVGREDVILRTIQILNKKIKNNVLHIGEPGVGKTALTKGLSRMIKEGKVPEQLKNKKVYQLDIAGLVAGSKYRGEMEEKLVNTLHQLEDMGDIILYIDEIHTIMGAGAGSESPLDVANILKPYIASNKIRFIGTTTLEEYRKHIEKDKALARRFQTINIAEPTIEQAEEILSSLKSDFEKYHKLKINKDAISAAVTLSAKHIKDRFLPDKAIDILDEAASSCAISGKKTLNRNDIVDTISRVCRIPSKNIKESDKERMSTLLPNLVENVVGQREAADALTKYVQLSRCGLGEDNKPVASLLFVGPTGVGKTEMARTLANTLNVPLIKYDMSEFSDQTSVNKLIGASAGYVGYEDGGRLVKDIRNNPYCVLLLDEIEKAHPLVYNALLQVMDDAKLTDSSGNTADFRNVVIIMTSNAGAATVKTNAFGFGAENHTATEGIDKAVRETFSPEFRNRLQGIIKFNPMSREMAMKIAEKHLNILAGKLLAKGIIPSWNEDVPTLIVDKCTDFANGGREIIRIIDDLKEMFVPEMLFGKLKNGGSVKIETDNGNFKLSVGKRSLKKSTAVSV